MPKKDETDQLVGLMKDVGVIRSRDLAAHGISRQALARLVRSGRAKRVARGIYSLHNFGRLTEFHAFAEASKKTPHGVICLLSALVFHELTTQNPGQVWMAIGTKTWTPLNSHLPVRYVRFSQRALTEGVTTTMIEGVEVRIYDPSKTIADCFKYRNKIGLDVALEALRECRRVKKCSMDNLWRSARICRVTNVMRPYLEAIS